MIIPCIDLQDGKVVQLIQGRKKALEGAPPLEMLERFKGFPVIQVIDLDAGCCGMAGSFGYTRDHYDVSRAIGERKLLPAARAMAAGSVLVAGGTSCRHQVADFAGVTAVHPAVLLRSLL